MTSIGGNGALFVGEDKVFRLKNVVDENNVLVDMTGWSVLFDVRAKTTSSDPALISINATPVGVYNVNPVLNTQMWVAPVSDDLLNLFKAKTYQYSWKRMDAGVETVLAYGPMAPEKATAP
ncbi:MAG: hypothetical protein V4529_17005 [Gemmatimonadota bacterium]